MTRRATLCTCGGDIFEKGLDDSLQPVWRCDNCSRETPRKRVIRKSNRSRAIESYLAIRADWKATDDRLTAVIDSGKAKTGALLVHSSCFNYHLKQLVDLEAPSNFQVRYHAEQARIELAAAQAFVAEREQAS